MSVGLAVAGQEHAVQLDQHPADNPVNIENNSINRIIVDVVIHREYYMYIPVSAFQKYL